MSGLVSGLGVGNSRKGTTVLISFIGGGLGHLGIQFAKAKGIKIVGIDARDEGIALSKEVGADIVVDARKDKKEVIKQVMQATGGEGCYATINVSDARSAAALACAITKVHGKMVRQAYIGGVCGEF